MKAAQVYRSAKTYELVMLLLYRRHYFTRYRVLADLIDSESTVLDLCCGPAVLYERYLRNKAITYTGLDVNDGFIKRLTEIGSHGQVWDLREDRPLPPADYVVMQASLYHFLPDPGAIVDRMLKAARKAVIIAEPIRNWSSGNIPVLRNLGRRLTDPGTGQQGRRFTEQTLDDFFSRYGSHLIRTFVIPGGREKVYILGAAA